MVDKEETEEQEPKTLEERVDAMEGGVTTILDLLENLTKRIEEVDKKAVKKSAGLFGGKRTKTAIKDTKTGTVYPSKARLGKELAGKEGFEGIDPGNNFAYYQIIAKAPDRFVDASAEEAEKVWAEEKVRREAEVAEANKRLAEEEAAKQKAEAEAKAKAKK